MGHKTGDKVTGAQHWECYLAHPSAQSILGIIPDMAYKLGFIKIKLNTTLFKNHLLFPELLVSKISV